MKALMIGFAVLVLSGCGGSDAIGPDDGGSDVTKYDNGYECYSDNECKVGWGCVDHKCVDKPECKQDADCNDTKQEQDYWGFECRSGKCSAVVYDDTCYKKECTGYCTSCGNYTTCFNNTCEESCVYSYKFSLVVYKDVCNKLLNKCNSCVCYSQDKCTNSNGECVECPKKDFQCNSSILSQRKSYNKDQQGNIHNNTMEICTVCKNEVGAVWPELLDNCKS